MPRRTRHRLDRRTHGADADAPTDPDDLGRDRRVQVKMLVGVDVVEGQAGGRKGRELCFDLGGKLPPYVRSQEGEAGADHIVAKPPVVVDQVGQLLGRQHRPAIDQHEMKPDPQARQSLGALDRVGHGRARDHQAGRTQYTVAVRLLDRLVDCTIGAEIVGGNDQLLQATASLRRRRKSKNSTPSRSRRFIMSKSRSISATIEPILRGRK